MPEPACAGPAVVLGHGLGAVKEMRLDAYSERFAAAGYTAVAFDYRRFGSSGGRPRQLLDITEQLGDWAAAIAYTRALPQVDPARIALFGTSFGGGYAIVSAARDPRIAAVIAQGPFTSGVASALKIDLPGLAKLVPVVLRDEWARIRHKAPVTVAIVGPPRSAALINSPGAVSGFLGLAPAGMDIPNEVAARLAPQVPFYRPGRHTKKVRCPVLFAICDKDLVTPPAATARYAARAPRGEIKRYPVGHFAIYHGEAFEKAVTDQLDFLRRHLPAPPPLPARPG
ncbi:MAG TPA: alpha/beta fold hydrolase [Streptosporangiaceae bacterium]|nr:alpha/beta fold hydrolase [Streptosporangiaceae bacterium]